MYDERFARQYRYEPPSEFPLTLPFAGIVHHLSGPTAFALSQATAAGGSVADVDSFSDQCLLYIIVRIQVCTLIQ